MASTEPPLVAHPPAIKVGGRRLSTSSRSKHHTSTDPQSPSSPPGQTQSDTADYPRPGAPGGGTETEPEGAHPPPHHEEDVPKKDNKHHHGAHDNEKKMKESAYRKVEATRPTREGSSARKDFGASGRISQP